MATPPSRPLSPDIIPARRWRWPDMSPDWWLAAALLTGLVIMLAAAGASSQSGSDGASGPRLAVGMTPTDGAITVRIEPCGSEQVEAVSLSTVDPELTLWHATAITPQDRYVYVVGQAPTVFVEIVPMIETLPRGSLLEATIETDESRSVRFFYADLLPGLWNYADTYYDEERISAAIESESACVGGVVTATAGRRALVVVGFLLAAGSGAAMLARRMVSPDLQGPSR